MANAFDQFDDQAKTADVKSAANPFDQFDAQKPSVAADVAKSGGIGLAKGLIAGFGTPGDVSDLLAKGSKVAGDYIGGKLGFEPSPEHLAPPMLPTSDLIQKGIETQTGDFYKPHTAPGKYAEKATEFAANPFSYIGPGGALSKAATAAGSGLGSELGTQLTQSSDKPWVRAMGPLLGAIAGGHITPGSSAVTNAVPGSHLSDIATLQREGIPLTAGDITGNKNLRVVESQLSSGRNEAQDTALKQAAFNRAGETIGDRSIKGKDGAVDTMMKRTGGVFDTLAGRNTLYADPQLSTDLTDVYRKYNGMPGLYSPEVVNAVTAATGRVQQVLQHGGVISGPDYRTLRSDLRDAAMNATDTDKAQGLHAVTNALDSAMERSVQANNPSDAGAFAKANRDYRNALVLQDWAGAANMTPATLAQSAKRIYDKKQYVRGMDDFSDLAESARNVMKQYPDSGTASRASVEKALANMGAALTHAIGAGGGYMAGHHFLGGPDPNVEGILLGEGLAPFVMKPVARAALMNPLTQSAISKQTSPNTIALMNAIRGNQNAAPPVPGARQAKDGKYYVADPSRPGKYLEARP